MSERIGFVGLGIMGAGMASNLIEKGHDVVVWNRTASRMEPLVTAGASAASSPAKVGRLCSIVMICVSDTPDVEAVLHSDDGLLAGVSAGSLVIDHSTISPGATVGFAEEVASLGGSWIDAPVSGGDVGAINAKIDLSLVSQIARRHPEWSFLMVGPITSEEPEDQSAYSELLALPNVLFVGRVDVAEVPHYINACDVCLMPYKVNVWTKHVNSLKLFEYLACGKPVVGTDIAACREVGEYVRVATDAEDFEQQIAEALRENGSELVAGRRALAARNTWEERVEMLSRAIDDGLVERQRLQKPA